MCGTEDYADSTVWVSTEEFMPEGLISKDAYDYDTLCTNCYQSLVSPNVENLIEFLV